MRAFRSGLFCVLAIAPAACVSNAPQEQTASSPAAAGDRSGKVCRMETPTGSNLSREICRTPEEMASDRKDAEDLFRNQGARTGVRTN
jgi:hypothetical protein